MKPELLIGLELWCGIWCTGY